MRYPLLLVSFGIHGAVLLGLFFLVQSNPNGNGAFGSANADTFSATWFWGEGSGNGGTQGRVGDTVVPDDDPDGSRDGTHSVEVQPAKPESPLLDVVQRDPQSVFDANSVAAVALLPDALSMADLQRQSTAGMNSLAKTDIRKLDGSIESRERSVTAANSSGQSVAMTRAASNGSNAGVKFDDLAAGPGVRADPGGGQSNGSGQGIEFFGIKAKAKRVVYVIDASESMRQHNAMELARRKLWSSLQGLTLTSQFQIVFFNLTTHTLSHPNERNRLLPATSQNLRLAKQLLTGIQPDSGTDRLAAITQALSFEPEVIFLLTDADAPELSAKDLWDIHRANKRLAVIHVVEFGIGGDLSQDSFLKKLARENHGSHSYHDLKRDSQ